MTYLLINDLTRDGEAVCYGAFDEGHLEMLYQGRHVPVVCKAVFPYTL